MIDNKPSIEIDKTKCIHCGLCLKDCMMGCLEFGEGNVPRYVEGGSERCVGCQHCMAICPRGALSFGGNDPGECAKSGTCDAEALLTLIKSRRSVRFFRDESLDEPTLAKLKGMLAYPPTGGNAPSLAISLVGTKEKMREIIDSTYRAIEANVDKSPILKFCVKQRKTGTDIIFRNAPSMAVAAVNPKTVVAGCEMADPIIALSYLELYAHSLGLGSLWNDLAVTVAAQIPAVSSLFGIPEGCNVGFVLLLGKPAVRYPRTVQKKICSVTII